MATCAHCSDQTVGNSKYCREHRALARAAWSEMIAEKSAARAKRDADFTALWARAHEAGMAAGKAINPTPMVVRPGAILFNGAPVSSETYYVPEGACGFAWVTVYPGNSSFALWAKRNRGARKSYRGGMEVVWVGEFGQSVDRKGAYADAFASVLRGAGIKAYSGSRLD